VFAGVDYAAIMAAAAAEADVVLWDGGNNDTPFFLPDLWLCVADPFRPRAQETHYPGDANFRRAHVIVVNKANTAPKVCVCARGGSGEAGSEQAGQRGQAGACLRRVRSVHRKMGAGAGSTRLATASS
jgi:hypothetical protein